MRVLAEMLHHFTNPEQQKQQKSLQVVETRPDPADLELMHQLYATCKAMQERVVDLIGRLVDDEITAELLRINDELNNLFLRYSRYTKNKTVPAASAILAQTLGPPSKVPHKRQEQSLIDLDEDSVNALEGAIGEIGTFIFLF